MSFEDAVQHDGYHRSHDEGNGVNGRVDEAPCVFCNGAGVVPCSAAWDAIKMLVMATWPTHKWGEGLQDAYIGEVARKGLTPEQVARGIRASTSPFPPSSGEIQGLYWSSLPPVSTADLVRAEELQRERFEAEREQWMLEQEAETDLPAIDEGSA